MGRPRKVRPNWNELATIWTVSDELWQVIQPVLAEVDPPKATGRPRVDARRTLLIPVQRAKGDSHTQRYSRE